MASLSSYIAYNLLAGPEHLEGPRHVLYDAFFLPGACPGWAEDGGMELPLDWQAEMKQASRDRQIRYAQIAETEGPQGLRYGMLLERHRYIAARINKIVNPINHDFMPLRGELHRLSPMSAIFRLPADDKINDAWKMAALDTCRVVMRIANQQPSDSPIAADYLKKLPSIVEHLEMALEASGAIPGPLERSELEKQSLNAFRTLLMQHLEATDAYTPEPGEDGMGAP